ncbi:MAG TPA: endonuclease/exonuclease/phosphatase family protein [Myxococcales bacterium]|nr:endonuclease/exonuclease/phosphatase family protein [Myxococcales bacterium]
MGAWLVVAGVLAPALAAAAAPAAEEPSTLSILTWNVFMMPGWTRESPANEERARAIASELSKLDYDVIVLEKVFDAGARRELDRTLGERYPYRFGPVNGTGCSLKINGGVYVLSRVPLGGYREIQFDDSADVEVFSRKGAMLLSGERGGRRFQLAATHLQGDEGTDPKFQRVRNRQLDQIEAELLAPHADPEVPLFIAGDFVTPKWVTLDDPGETDAYRRLLKVLMVEDGPGRRVTLDDDRTHNQLASDDTGRLAELDYVLVRRNGHEVKGTWERLILQHPWGDNTRKDLSYRYAVAAKLTWR